MDKDRIKGSAQQAKGAVKEVAGKITGDTKLEAEGKIRSCSSFLSSSESRLFHVSRTKFVGSGLRFI